MTLSFSRYLFANHHYGVLGLGQNGRAVVEALISMGATIQAWDDNSDARLSITPTDKVTLMPFHDTHHLDGLILSPGIAHLPPDGHPMAILAQKQGTPILSDAELLYQACRKSGIRTRFAGITGTNGKSTTTMLLGHLLQQSDIPVAMGGNLGQASLSLPRLPNDGVYVLEMSSYMLERLSTIRFDAASLLNISSDHLARHKTLSKYSEIKSKIFDRQNSSDAAIIAMDDTYCRNIAHELSTHSSAKLITISIYSQSTDYYLNEHCLMHCHEKIADLALAPALPGLHNAQNAAVAVAMAITLGTSPKNIQPALSNFRGLAHRQQLIRTLQEVKFIDDSKATNANAAEKALLCYQHVIWIAGGLAKAGGIETLVPLFPRIEKAFLIGQDAPYLAQTLAQHNVEFELTINLDRAVRKAWQTARDRHIPVVLLSPACSSFDQYANFEERGQHFAQLVAQLP